MNVKWFAFVNIWKGNDRCELWIKLLSTSENFYLYYLLIIYILSELLFIEEKKASSVLHECDWSFYHDDELIEN